jgi:hypothetical protein
MARLKDDLGSLPETLTGFGFLGLGKGKGTRCSLPWTVSKLGLTLGELVLGTVTDCD